MSRFGGETGQCPRCSTTVTFVQQHGCNLKGTVTGDTLAGVTSTVCPACQGVVVFVIRGLDDFDRYPLPQPVSVPGTPSRVDEAFREAQLALAAMAPHAAATMLRRAVASACTDRGIPDEVAGHRVGLNKRIEQLKNHLLPVTFDAAISAKLLGDAGAHEEAEDRLGPMDIETVAEAIEVVRYVLSNLYEVPLRVRGLATTP